MSRCISKRVPIVKLIQENMDSIALSTQQRSILNQFNLWEVTEDNLKDYICYEIEHSTGRMKLVLQRILDLILKIDKNQDEHIEKITKSATIISYINRLSNEILKPLDVSYKPKRTQLQLLVAARDNKAQKLKGGYWK